MSKTLDVGFCDRKIETLCELESAKVLSLDETVLDNITQTFSEHYDLEKRIFEDS